MEFPAVESLNNGNNVNSINTAGATTSKDGNKNMFLQRERPRIQSKRPIQHRNFKNPGRQSGRHQLSKRQRHNLSRHRRNIQLILPIPKKLIHKRQKTTRHQPQHPCSKRQGRLRRVIGDRNRQPDLLDRTVVFLLCTAATNGET